MTNHNFPKILTFKTFDFSHGKSHIMFFTFKCVLFFPILDVNVIIAQCTSVHKES